MLDLILIVAPVVAVVLIGFASVRFNFVGQPVIDGLSRFVFAVALPALLFRNLAGGDIAGNLDFIWRVLLSYYLGALAVLVIGILVAKFVFRMGQAEQHIFGVGASHSNVILLGVPAIVIVFNAKFVLPLLLIAGLHGLLMAILLTIVLRVRARRFGELPQAIWQATLGQVKNPIFIALAAGILYSLLVTEAGLGKLPAEINTILRILGSAVLPAGLFALGGMMVRHRFSGQAGEAVTLSAIKLAAFPAIVWALASPLLGLNNWAWIAALMAAMPAGFNVHNMASSAKKRVGMAESTIVISTVASIVAVIALLYFRQG